MSIQRHEEKSAPAHRRERERARFGSSIYMFISTWACSMQIGSARSVVCFTRGPHSGPWTFFCSIFAGFSLSCLLATAILDSFSLFYLPNILIRQKVIKSNMEDVSRYPKVGVMLNFVST